MKTPLTKEQRARMREWLATVKSVISIIVGEYMQELLDSHALVDEALDLAKAKLATAEICECVYDDSWKTSQDVVTGARVYNKKCPHCTNGVHFSDERARELLERLKRAEEDSARLQWYLSDKPKAFLDTYTQGVREQWDIERWRCEIDSAIAKEGSSS